MKELITKNFQKVEQSILALAQEKEHYKAALKQTEQILARYDTLSMRFELVLEIVCNIFFRAVEMAEYGALSPEINECIARMKQLSLISSEELWRAMITSRLNLSSTLKQEERIRLCNEIFTCYLDELENLCVCVKQRYAIIP